MTTRCSRGHSGSLPGRCLRLPDLCFFSCPGVLFEGQNCKENLWRSQLCKHAVPPANPPKFSIPARPTVALTTFAASARAALSFRHLPCRALARVWIWMPSGSRRSRTPVRPRLPVPNVKVSAYISFPVAKPCFAWTAAPCSNSATKTWQARRNWVWKFGLSWKVTQPALAHQQRQCHNARSSQLAAIVKRCLGL